MNDLLSPSVQVHLAVNNCDYTTVVNNCDCTTIKDTFKKICHIPMVKVMKLTFCK